MNGPTFASAENFLTNVGKKISYDIYLQGQEEQLIVIRDVEILRLETVNDIEFLVVRPSEFSLTSAEGFILFSYIKVILPNREMKIGTISTPAIKFR